MKFVLLFRQISKLNLEFSESLEAKMSVVNISTGLCEVFLKVSLTSSFCCCDSGGLFLFLYACVCVFVCLLLLGISIHSFVSLHKTILYYSFLFTFSRLLIPFSSYVAVTSHILLIIISHNFLFSFLCHVLSFIIIIVSSVFSPSIYICFL